MSTQQQNADGTWTPAAPLVMDAEIDFEVYGSGRWVMYDGWTRVTGGTARTRLGRAIAMWRAKRAYLREVQG